MRAAKTQLIFSVSLRPGELPMRGLVIGSAVFDQSHRSKRAAIEIPANRRTVLVDGAALLAEVDARTIRTASEHQLAITGSLGEQMGQASAIALLVDGNSGIVTAGCTRAARNRPSLAAPPSRKEIASGARD
jgi:hypothetical protein